MKCILYTIDAIRKCLNSMLVYYFHDWPQLKSKI